MGNSGKTYGKLQTLLLLLPAICLSALPVHAKYGGGTGEPNDPYLIFDANQMNAIGADSNDWDKHFLLCADIDLSEFTGSEFNIIGRGRYDCLPPPFGDCSLVITPFTGVFDGNGHTISNFTYEFTGNEFVGLFGCVDGEDAQINNLGLRDVDIDVKHDGNDPDHGATGSLIGLLFDGTVIGCSQDGSVSGDGYYYHHVGGLVGLNENGTISHCFSTCSVSGNDRAGGLVGRNFRKGTISNCYSNASAVGVYEVGGLVGINDGTIIDSYSTGSASGSFYVGGLTGHNFGTITDSFWDVNTSGLDYSDGGVGKTTVEMQTKSTFTDAGWDFIGETVNGPNDIWKICEGQDYPRLSWEKYGGGSGTAENPYLIYTSRQMNEIGADPCDWDKHFLLCADIDLSEYTGTEFNLIGRGRYECIPPPGGTCWPVGDPFTGVFDGNGHTISNFTYQYSGGEFVGLFGCVDGEYAQIKNLVLRDVDIYAHFGEVVGSLIGILFNGTAINCYTQGGSVSGDYRVGGLVGRSEEPAFIVNCYTDVNVSGHGDIGGLVGWNFGTISNCYSSASVIGVYFVGGLTGRNFGAIRDSYSTGSVSGRTDVGGLVGLHDEGIIANCYSGAAVSGTINVGGFAGINSGVITDSFWDTGTSGLSNMCGFEGGGGSGCYDGNGKSTTEMQTKSTFTDAGWDFVGETVNGSEYIWRMCLDGVDYPRLSWEFYSLADFVCPDGVNFFDFSFFASRWAEDNCGASNDCDGRDLDLLGSVDIRDLRIFTDHWLEGL